MRPVQSLGYRLDDQEIMWSYMAREGAHVLLQSIQQIQLMPTST